MLIENAKIARCFYAAGVFRPMATLAHDFDETVHYIAKTRLLYNPFTISACQLFASAASADANAYRRADPVGRRTHICQ